jgi:hypothetical protein
MGAWQLKHVRRDIKMATSSPFKWREAKITFILLNTKIWNILLHKKQNLWFFITFPQISQMHYINVVGNVNVNLFRIL